MDSYRKKRHAAPGPSKSELRASRTERQERERSLNGTLHDRFPHVRVLILDFHLETAMGATLEAVSRSVSLNEPMLLNIPCPGGCGGGLFLLTEAVEGLLQANLESREGLALCQAASYADPRIACGTKLYYRITVQYLR